MKPFLSSDSIGSEHEASHLISKIKIGIEDRHLKEAHCVNSLQDPSAINCPIQLRLCISHLEDRFRGPKLQDHEDSSTVFMMLWPSISQLPGWKLEFIVGLLVSCPDPTQNLYPTPIEIF